MTNKTANEHAKHNNRLACPTSQSYLDRENKQQTKKEKHTKGKYGREMGKSIRHTCPPPLALEAVKTQEKKEEKRKRKRKKNVRRKLAN
jgi:Fe-S-cluster-containing hydrogenase component 2